MSRLVEITNDEYKLIRKLTAVIKSVEAEDRDYLPRFLEDVQKELLEVLSKRIDYNNVKRKYYILREKQRINNDET